ncbi:MAG: hypothetical protein ACI9OJ_003262, partial [Myxococcota bacterium]
MNRLRRSKSPPERFTARARERTAERLISLFFGFHLHARDEPLWSPSTALTCPKSGRGERMDNDERCGNTGSRLENNSPNILKYWLGAIRHEEALGAYIRAAPPNRKERQPDISEPDRGQPYFKLPRTDATLKLLFDGSDPMDLPVNTDRVAFLEHWLRRRYQRDRTVHFSRVTADTENDSWLAGFPVLYDARRGQLFTLLQRQLHSPIWLTATGQLWEPPTFRDRSRHNIPPPPLNVRLIADTGPEDGPAPPPFAVCEAVLSRALGVQEEQLAAFSKQTATTDARGLMWRTIALLKTAPGVDPPPPGPCPPDATPESLLAELTDVAAARVASRQMAVWPMALAYDGGANYATHHLQRDLEELLSAEVHVSRRTPLDLYLRSEPGHRGRGLAYGAHAGLNPTPSQREAAERFVGSALTCVQGPPGTGKTRLILNLAAQMTIERGAAICARVHTPHEPLLLVTSTNNRAVDNVVEPLSDDLPDERLPLMLRLGSRAVMESVTLPTVQRVLTWLRSTPSAPDAESRRADFQVTLSELMALAEPVRGAFKAKAQVEAATIRRAELVETITRLAGECLDADGKPTDFDDEIDRLRTVERAARLLSTFVDKATGDLATLQSAARASKARRIWRGWGKSWPTALDDALTALDLSVDMTAPETDSDGTQWTSALLGFLDQLSDIENTLDDLGEKLRTKTATAVSLDEARADLEILDTAAAEETPAVDEAAYYALLESSEHELFSAACQVREQWALEHKTRLIASLLIVEKTLRSRLSLRGFAESQGPAWRDLRALFPVMGCTLLSLGNSFDLEEGAISHIVIDEAGQCHPAHAVSALYRAERALIIGDPHQLEPVIELNSDEEERVLRRIGMKLDGLDPYRALSSVPCSAQLLAGRATGEIGVLREHFRCQPEIIEISNRLCNYDLDVRTVRASYSDR